MSVYILIYKHEIYEHVFTSFVSALQTAYIHYKDIDLQKQYVGVQKGIKKIFTITTDIEIQCVSLA